MRTRYLSVVFACVVGLALVVYWQVSAGPAAASAVPAAELHVCPSGCAYSSVQAAVDAATDGDVIKVATGTYTGVDVRPRADVATTGMVTQIAYISKTVTVQGGYTTADWTTPDPGANPTTLDAQGQGRVLYITGDISPIVQGLRITGGDATGLGGWLDPFGGDADTDAGGGVYVISATATLQDNDIYANTSTRTAGGGALLYSRHTTFRDNVVSGNNATDSTGGLLVFASDGTIRGNTISDNTAGAVGGLELWGSHVTVEGNAIHGNTTTQYGCGGVRIFVSRTTLRGNVIMSNTAAEEGGGVCLRGGSGDQDTLINNVIADNQAGTGGSGLDIWSEPHLLHNTIAGNTGGDGTGIYLHAWNEDPIRVTLTNTILADQSVGIRVSGGCTLTADGLLWYNTPVTVSKSPTATVSLQNQHTGDPAFVNPGGGDYHIGNASAARNAGVETGVHTDLDGQWRPMGVAPDLGADEYPGPGLDVEKQASQALVNGGQDLTYTVVVTSAGEESAIDVVVTDTLDAWQRPVTIATSQGACTLPGYDWGGAAVCTLGSMPAGATVVMTLTAQVSTTVPAGQHLVNVVVAQGTGTAVASAQSSVLAQDCHVRINDGATEYTTVQAAADAANPGDVVKVAGTCIGVNTRAGRLQQVYLDKNLTLQGGYTPGNWTTPDPQAHPTTLDALGQGRVLYVTEPAPGAGVDATVAGLGLTGGDTSWMDGDLMDLCGGGVHVVSATITLEDNQVFGNAAWSAGGLCLLGSEVTLRNNSIHDNTGAFVGGLYLSGSHGALSGDTITGNRTTEWSAGGAALYASQVTLDGLLVRENRSARTAGGLLIYNNSDATLTNSVVADNQAATEGGGLVCLNTTARLVHTTVARNSSADGSGIQVRSGGPELELSSLKLTNTILADHSVGITVTGGCTVTANGLLWHNTPLPVSASPTATVSLRNQHSGDPAFDADGYHLLPHSAAIDRGVDAGVTVDIDGDARPVGAAPDLGADEDGVVADLSLVKRDDPDPCVVGQPLTYTLAVANHGPAAATGVALTETLPGGTTFVSASAGCDRVGGNVVCDLGDMAAGEQQTASIHLTPNSTGQLIDLAVVQANEPDPNAGNDADSELTAIVAAPVLDPALSGISPDYGTNDGPTAVTIEGQRFQDGATASLDSTALESVSFVDAQHLQATVPAGLTPGAYALTVTNPDGRSATLPGAFTVLAPGGPTVTSLSPAQGPIDTPITVDIRGLNFSSAVSATLHMDGSQVALPALVFIDSTRLFATVPVSITPGVYTLTVTNPDGLSGSLPDAYEALAPEVNDDLYAGETDLWLDPPTVHQGDTPRIGLTLRRQGGQADLEDVQVRFYLAGGTPAFTGTAPALTPWGHVTVTVPWTPSPQQGEHTLYAVIDPLGAVDENDEANNVVSRTVTVLPPLPDTTPPVVEQVTINDGALVTDQRWNWLDVEASDNPGGSGVAHLLIRGYYWSVDRNDWREYYLEGTSGIWLPYEGPGAEYAWRVVHSAANYVQVWAADAAGNISVLPAGQIINFVGPMKHINSGSVDVYRLPREVGQGVHLRIATVNWPCSRREVYVGVWAPDGGRLWWAKVTADREQQYTFEAQQNGVYQIEVEGTYGSNYYELTLVPLDGTQAGREGAWTAADEWRTEPIVPPWNTPSRYVGIPSAPLVRHSLYLPLVLR